MKNAVNNAFLNVSTNILVLVVSASVSLWLTPYLITQLGIEVYGVVPLFATVLSYLGLLTTVLSSSVARYVSLHYYKGEIEQANIYLSSAFWGLIGICGVVLAGAAAFSPFLQVVFNVPAGYESQTRGLFLLVIAASLLAALKSLYGRSCFILHKFYWLDLLTIASNIVRVAIIVLGFTYISKSLVFVGWGTLVSALFALALTALVDMLILPELKIRYRRFNWTACKEMIAMGTGVSINQFGALLYLNSDLIVINILLGSLATGQYGPFVQWAFLIRTLAAVVMRLFDPVVMELVANKDYDLLLDHLFRLTKLLGLIIGLPILLVSGFSKPLLLLWLGEDFSDLYKLMILLVLGQIVPYSLGNIFSIFRGLNTLYIPGVVTVAAGVANIVLSVILIKYTPLGIYGAGIATVIAVFAKSVLFNVIYLSKIMQFNPWKIWISIIKGCLPAGVGTVLLLVFSNMVHVNTIAELGGYGALFGVVYSLICFKLVLDQRDRVFCLRVFKADRYLSPRMINYLQK